MLLQMDSNSLVIKQKRKQTTKQNVYLKIEFFVPYDVHQNCLDKPLLRYQI